MMTVKELIGKLQKLDPDAVVEVSTTNEIAEAYDVNPFVSDDQKYVRIEST